MYRGNQCSRPVLFGASGEADDSNGSAGSAQSGEEECTGSTQAYNAQADNKERSVAYSFRAIKAPIANHVTFTGTTVSAVYDGKPHVASTATVTANNGRDVVVEYQKADGDWTTDPAEITATNVAVSTTVKVRASVPSYYEGYVYAAETLAINQRPVTLTSESQELTYNGQPQKWEYAGVTSGSFAEGEGMASYPFSNSFTNAGERVDNAFTYTLNGKTDADNYKIETSYGTITVKPVADEAIVKVVGHKASDTYDGDEHAVSGKSSSATKAGSTAKTGDAVTPFAAGAGIVAMAAALAAFFVSRKPSRSESLRGRH